MQIIIYWDINYQINSFYCKNLLVTLKWKSFDSILYQSTKKHITTPGLQPTWQILSDQHGRDDHFLAQIHTSDTSLPVTNCTCMKLTKADWPTFNHRSTLELDPGCLASSETHAEVLTNNTRWTMYWTTTGQSDAATACPLHFYLLPTETRSSAVAERPRDASRHWIFC